MTITITFDDNELDAALKEHLTTGRSMQQYIRAAINFFDDMRGFEQAGNKVGYGDASRFTSYNKEVSPDKYLKGNN